LRPHNVLSRDYRSSRVDRRFKAGVNFA